MFKKYYLKISIIIGFLFFNILGNYQAEKIIYDEESQPITDNEICMQQQYIIDENQREDTKLQYMLLILNENNYLMYNEYISSFEASINLDETFLGKKKILTIPLKDGEYNYSQMTERELTIVDCGLEPNEENQETSKKNNSILAEFEISDNLIINKKNPEEFPDYKIHYKLKNMLNVKELKENDSISISDYPQTIQLTQEYYDNNKNKKHNFEIIFLDKNTHIIRTLSTLDDQKIKITKYINKNNVILILVLLILIFILKKKQIKTMKKYRRLKYKRRKNQKTNKKEEKIKKQIRKKKENEIQDILDEI